MGKHEVSTLGTRVRFPPPASSEGLCTLLSTVKTAERKEARRLRKEEGRSVKELAALLHYSKYSQKKRRNKLPYGTCRLCVYSTEITQRLYGAIQEYGGFEREEWLM